MLPENTAVKCTDASSVMLDQASGFVIAAPGDEVDEVYDGERRQFVVPDDHAYVEFRLVDAEKECGVRHRELMSEENLEVTGC